MSSDILKERKVEVDQNKGRSKWNGDEATREGRGASVFNTDNRAMSLVRLGGIKWHQRESSLH